MSCDTVLYVFHFGNKRKSYGQGDKTNGIMGDGGDINIIFMFDRSDCIPSQPVSLGLSKL